MIISQAQAILAQGFRLVKGVGLAQASPRGFLAGHGGARLAGVESQARRRRQRCADLDVTTSYRRSREVQVHGPRARGNISHGASGALS